MNRLISFIVLIVFSLSWSTREVSGQSFDLVGKMIDNFDAIQNLYFLVSNSSSSPFLYTHQKGNTSIDEVTEILSASKIVSVVTVMKLVEKGKLTLSDYVHQHLGFWTKDPSDLRSQVTIQHLLSFTSGFEGQRSDPTCIGNGSYTLYECSMICYQQGLFLYTPGTVFRYGSIHLQFAGSIVESITGKTYFEFFEEEILRPLGMTKTIFNPFSGKNPALAFGLMTNTRDYNRFLSAYFEDKILPTNLRKLMEIDNTPNRDAVLLPGYHYCLGNWFECRMTKWVDECYEENVHGSVGAYGFYPLVDRKLNYYFIIGTNIGVGGTTTCSILRHQIKPIIDQIVSKK